MISLSKAVANRGWTVRPINISDVAQRLFLGKSISLTELGGKSPNDWFGAWVTSLYNDILGRPPENQYVIDKQIEGLCKGNWPRDVVHQFLTSQELGYAWGVWLYRHYLNREPEAGAAEGRAQQFMQYFFIPQPPGFPLVTQFSFQQVTTDFCNSDEFKTKHPVPKEFLRSLYYKILDRKNDPEVNDPGGFQYWLSKLSSGTSTVDVILGFLKSPEYAYLTANNYFMKYLRREHSRDPNSGHVKRIMNMDPLQEIIKDIVCSSEYIHGALNRAQPPTPPITLRVATFNLWMSTPLQDDDKWYWSGRFRLPVTFTNDQRLLLISQFLNDVLKPDICFFQEVDNGTDRSKLSDGTRVNQAEWLAKNTCLKYWVFDADRLDYQWGQVGSAILSRFPIDKYTSYYIPGDNYGTGISDIYITIQGIQFRCLGAHFNHAYPNKRYEAAENIVSLLDQDRRTPVIFGGDLNLKPFPPRESHFERDRDSLRVLKESGKLTDSFYAAHLQYREEKNNCYGCQDAPKGHHAVDYIFISGGEGNFKVKSWYAPWGSPGPQALTDHTVPRVELEYTI